MSKNIPGIVRRGRRRNEEKVRIVVQPNPYPLEQPGMQPNNSGPMTPPMQPSVQPNQMQPGPMPPQMQSGPMPNQMQSGPMPPQMQPGVSGPMSPQMLAGGPVVPMQSSGQWRGDPNGQPAQPYQQGNNQTWQGRPQEAVGAPNMPQQPAQPGYNNQPWAANSQQQPMTPPQMPNPFASAPPNNGAPMQQGRGTPPPYNNVLTQTPTPNQRPAPTPQRSPEPHTPALSQPAANLQYPPAQPERTPMANAPYPPATGMPQPSPVPRPSSSGLLSHSQPGIAGPAIPMATAYIEIDGKIIQEVRLDKPALTVGRQDGRDIQIKHQSVSRTHAKISAENGTWIVEDAGSVNGIVFNGHRVQRTVVNTGDRVYIAPNIALIFKLA